MSGGNSCNCAVRDKKNWVVTRRHYNNSYFQKPKGEPHYSDYSSVYCSKCRKLWRTKSKYVKNLPDGDLK